MVVVGRMPIILVIIMHFHSLSLSCSYVQMDEFSAKMSGLGPRVKRNDPPQSRTEFDGLTDLLKYVSSWGRE